MTSCENRPLWDPLNPSKSGNLHILSCILGLRQAKAGYTLFCVHLVLAKVKAGHVIGMPTGGGREPTLNDVAGRKYPPVTFGITFGLEHATHGLGNCPGQFGPVSAHFSLLP